MSPTSSGVDAVKLWSATLGSIQNVHFYAINKGSLMHLESLRVYEESR